MANLTSPHNTKRPLESTEQLAERKGLAPFTLRKWRHEGRGPEFIRVSARCIRYDPDIADAWFEARRARSTTQPTAAELSA